MVKRPRIEGNFVVPGAVPGKSHACLRHSASRDGDAHVAAGRKMRGKLPGDDDVIAGVRGNAVGDGFLAGPVGADVHLIVDPHIAQRFRVVDAGDYFGRIHGSISAVNAERVEEEYLPFVSGAGRVDVGIEDGSRFAGPGHVREQIVGVGRIAGRNLPILYTAIEEEPRRRDCIVTGIAVGRSRVPDIGDAVALFEEPVALVVFGGNAAGPGFEAESAAGSVGMAVMRGVIAEFVSVVDGLLPAGVIPNA